MPKTGVRIAVRSTFCHSNPDGAWVPVSRNWSVSVMENYAASGNGAWLWDDFWQIK